MLFRKKIDRACQYCRYGAQIEDGLILCPKKGLKTPDSNCRKFKYDPCKRIPKKARALDFSKYDEEDYTL